MAGPHSLSPEEIREAQDRQVHVIIKDDAGNVEGEFEDSLLHVADAIQDLPTGWSADVTDV